MVSIWSWRWFCKASCFLLNSIPTPCTWRSNWHRCSTSLTFRFCTWAFNQSHFCHNNLNREELTLKMVELFMGSATSSLIARVLSFIKLIVRTRRMSPAIILILLSVSLAYATSQVSCLLWAANLKSSLGLVVRNDLRRKWPLLKFYVVIGFSLKVFISVTVNSHIRSIKKCCAG